MLLKICDSCGANFTGTEWQTLCELCRNEGEYLLRKIQEEKKAATAASVIDSGDDGQVID